MDVYTAIIVDDWLDNKFKMFKKAITEIINFCNNFLIIKKLFFYVLNNGVFCISKLY